MKLRFKIYILLIVLLTGFLIYAVFFMKSDFIETESLPSSIAGSKVTVGDEHIEQYKPDFLPKPIPANVLLGAKENDFYHYLFFNPNSKVLLYLYKQGSKDPKNSEAFHQQIDSYIKKVLYDGNYKNKYLSEKGMQIYEKGMLELNEAANYTPKEGDSKGYQKKMLEKKARIDAVKAFREECTNTFCIINPKTLQYVVIDKRDVEVAKKALRDYRKW